MATFIIKLTDENCMTDFYFEWSTLVNAPITFGMPLIEFIAYYKSIYGKEGMQDFEFRIKRAIERGISTLQFDLATLLANNRAGKNNSCITKEEILERYSIENICHPFTTDSGLTKLDNIMAFKN